MARVLLYHILEGLHARYPVEAPRQFVDDLAQFAAGTPASVIDKVASSAIELVEGVLSKGCSISSKSKLVGSDLDVLHAIRARILAHTGIRLEIATWARDLGVTFSAKGRRRGAFAARAAKAKRRTGRVRQLAKATRQAAKLYRTGVWSQVSFGAEVHGIPATQLHRMRSLAAMSTGVPRSSCVTSAIAIGHGEMWDPAVRMRLQQVKAWLRLWCATSRGERPRIRRAWACTYRRLAQTPTRRRWRSVVGPMGATIATLLDIGWIPAAPDHWRSPECDWRFGDEYFETPAFTACIVRAAQAQGWRAAAAHYCGEGLADGGNFTVLRKHIQSLRAQGRGQEAAILQTIGAGGAWCEARFAEAGLWTSARCLRCGAAQGSHLHAYWECPDNDAIQDEAVQDTQHLCKRALAPAAPACFWTRGILPASWVQTTQPSEFDTEEFPWGQQSLFLAKDGDIRWATDGSGGKDSSQPLLRRCGWSAVAVRFSTDDLNSIVPLEFAARFGALPSCKQTVPRAEAYAFMRLQSLVGPQRIEALVDAQSVVDGCRHLDKAVRSGNGDIWADIRSEACQRAEAVVAKNVKSHAEDEDFELGLDPRDAVTNEIADLFAERAAELAAVPSAESLRVNWSCALAWKVQKRILCIARRCLEFRPSKDIVVRRSRNTKAPELTIGAEAKASAHVLRKRARWWQCTECGARPSRQGKRARLALFQSPCLAMPPSAPPQPLPPKSNSAVLFPGLGGHAAALGDYGDEYDDVFGHGALGLDDMPDSVEARAADASEHPCKKMREDDWPSKHPERAAQLMDATNEDSLVGEAGNMHVRFGTLPPWWKPAVGGVQLHGSHRFSWHRGVCWCRKCGAYSMQVARRLRAECPRVPTSKAAAERLRRLRQGLPPAVGVPWPMSENHQYVSTNTSLPLQHGRGAAGLAALRERVLARERDNKRRRMADEEVGREQP